MTPDITPFNREYVRPPRIISLHTPSDTEVNPVKSYLAIIIGGSAGCLIRWLLGARLNSLFPDLPPGTLVVNLAGGFIIGASLAWFMRHPDLDPAWRLLVITGLCGGLTTFSTFSLEIFSQLQSGNYFWAFTSLLVHVTGSILMTALGFFVVTWLL
jgi:CrcB protein